MASYFRQVPNLAYVSRNKDKKYISQYVAVKNLFKRGKLREDIFGNLSFFEKYSIVGDERPDNVAYKFYNDETLDWVVLLSNNILNIQSEWPMTQRTFDQVMLEKYRKIDISNIILPDDNGDIITNEETLKEIDKNRSTNDDLVYQILYRGIHHYETEEIKNSLGETVLKAGININPTWKTNGNFTELFNDKIFNLYAGDGITPSTRVVVESFNGIPSLKIGDPITIENFKDNRYNGKFIVTEVLNSVETSDGTNQFVVYSFAFELSSTPSNPNPLGTMFAPFTVTYDETPYKIDLYSGDGVTPTTTVTVNSINGIQGLSVGNTITIKNVTDSAYNGTFTVTDILQTGDDGSTISFTYELDQTPNTAFPQISPLQNIRPYKNVNEKFIAPKNEFYKPIVSEDITVSSSSYYYEYWDPGLGYSVEVSSQKFVKAVTNYEYELEIENEKRNIYVLKPRYLSVIFDDMKDLMTYKKGSQQYVSENLKRGDNIRLYE